MLLTARPLTDVANANSFQYTDVLEFTEGDLPVLHFQLVDEGLDRVAWPKGRRYIPAAGAQLEVTLTSIDSSKVIVRLASNPYPEDRSIFALALQEGDVLLGKGDMKLRLVEGARTTNGFASRVLSVQPSHHEF